VRRRAPFDVRIIGCNTPSFPVCTAAETRSGREQHDGAVALPPHRLDRAFDVGARAAISFIEGGGFCVAIEGCGAARHRSTLATSTHPDRKTWKVWAHARTFLFSGGRSDREAIRLAETPRRSCTKPRGTLVNAPFPLLMSRHMNLTGRKKEKLLIANALAALPATGARHEAPPSRRDRVSADHVVEGVRRP